MYQKRTSMFFYATTNAILFVILPISSFCLFFLCVVNEMRVKWQAVRTKNPTERSTTNPIWNQGGILHMSFINYSYQFYCHPKKRKNVASFWTKRRKPVRQWRCSCFFYYFTKIFTFFCCWDDLTIYKYCRHYTVF